MKKLVKIISLSLILVNGIEAKASYFNYKIKNNDSLLKIASKYNVSLKSLKNLNNIGTYDVIKVGKTLKIPQGNEDIHVVKKGDTLSVIAENNNTTVAKLKKLNNIENLNLIKFGDKIKLNNVENIGKTITNTTTTKHKVERGDTLSGIASKYKITTTQLISANNLKNKNIIKLGNVLNIPSNNWKPNYFKSIDVSNIKCEKVEKVEKIAKSKLGKKYVWGASGNGNTYDCSSFTQHVYKKMGINIPRTSRVQSKHGKYVKRNELKKGDLVFFDTSKKRKGYVNHVGIYLGNNKFIHASSAKKKVVVSKLDKNFYSARYKGARRLIKS